VVGHGTIKALRLEAPPADLFRRVVEARLRTVCDDVPDKDELTPLYPFQEEQVERIAQTEPTLRDMLQQCRHLFDHLVYGEVQKTAYDDADAKPTGRGPWDTPTAKSVTIVETVAEEPRILKMHPVRPAA